MFRHHLLRILKYPCLEHVRVLKGLSGHFWGQIRQRYGSIGSINFDQLPTKSIKTIHCLRKFLKSLQLDLNLIEFLSPYQKVF